MFLSLTNDIVCRVAFGKAYTDSKEGRKVKKLVVENIDLLCTYFMGDYIPWLGWIDCINGLDSKSSRSAKKVDEFFELQEHRDIRKSESGNRENGLDFVNVLLDYQSENKGSSCIDDKTIKAIIWDKFAGGTGITASVLIWTVSELIRNPRTMKTLKDEVRRVHSPVPLLIPYETTRDTQVMGYNVPKGTRVIVNAWAISRDPTIWENAEEFRPERFLEEDKSDIDHGSGLRFEFIPFGSGRRGCPGVGFTMAIVELTLAKLVPRFDLVLPNEERGEGIDMSEVGYGSEETTFARGGQSYNT